MLDLPMHVLKALSPEYLGAAEPGPNLGRVF